MWKKYKTEKDLETGLLRIIALKDFSDVKKGDKGGLIEKESNLSQKGNCWIYNNAQVYECAKVSGNARIYENAKVYGCAQIYGNARIENNVEVFENARVYENAQIYGDAVLYGRAKVYGEARVCGWARACGKANVSGNIKLWATYPSSTSFITTSLENNKDYLMFGDRKNFIIRPVEDIFITAITGDFAEENYINNLQIIRQLHGKEI